jgi:hypothetical protein
MKTCGLTALLFVVATSGAIAEEPGGRPTSATSLVVCPDPYDFPASMKDADPPGYDLEIIRAIAKVTGSRVEYVWADTGTRGGLGRALRNSIVQKKCNLFMGLGVSNQPNDEMKEKHLVFTRPYMSEAFVLVDKAAAGSKTKLSDFKDAKIGVAMSTPADAYLFDHGYQRSVFVRDRVIFKALEAGDIDVALVWSPDLAYIRKDAVKANFQVLSNYVPEDGLRWNIAIAVPENDTALKQMLDSAIADLLKSGEIAHIVESYGVPFYPPTS